MIRITAFSHPELAEHKIASDCYGEENHLVIERENEIFVPGWHDLMEPGCYSTELVADADFTEEEYNSVIECISESIHGVPAAVILKDKEKYKREYHKRNPFVELICFNGNDVLGPTTVRKTKGDFMFNMYVFERESKNESVLSDVRDLAEVFRYASMFNGVVRYS